ncbi:hypothetical protein FDP41_001068 [Naegleria fowleri]|uniref:HP domain-containing protein n=1 Tax=Naegleria fowleri TaxID=5763 RepID=A0A6A5C326_NAEFO|nr:uncharacterized protein FDP41_001068 [Naegleria fowleri]KAF0979915.1 hypothetical protein FDP41_001068 [Naegleria fowleri]
MLLNQTSSLVRSSKFRHLNGHESTKSERHENIPVGYGQKLSNTLKTNGTLYVLPYQSTGGSLLSYKRVNDYGKWDEKIQNYGLIKAHKGKLSDFDLSPFRDRNDLLTVSNSDNTIRLWKLNCSEEESTMNYKILEDCDLELNDPIITSSHSNISMISKVVFHPYIEKSIVSVQGEYMYWWDLEKRKIHLSLRHQKTFSSTTSSTTSTTSLITTESVSWNDNGQWMICGTSDRFIRIYDIRSGSQGGGGGGASSSSSSSTAAVQFVEAHSSMKPFQVLYNNGTPYVTSVGFSKSGSRECALYDTRKDLKCLQRVPIDNGASVLTPFYDPDIKLLYLAGRGDGNIRFYELEGGTLHYLNDYNCSSGASASVDWIPKWKLSVNDFELARFLRLTNDKTIETLSMRVSRKSNIEQYFQEDIFPDTWDGMPVCERVSEFERISQSGGGGGGGGHSSSGQSGQSDDKDTLSSLRKTMSLKPEGKISIYDVPVSEGGKVRPSSAVTTSASNNNSSSSSSNTSDDTHATATTSSTMTTVTKIPSLRSQLVIGANQDSTTLLSPTEITRQSLSLSMASSIARNSALAAANRPWYSKLFSGLGYYVGMAMFLLFRFTFISIPVFVYRKTTGYQPPPPPLQERFERQVPPMVMSRMSTAATTASHHKSSINTTTTPSKHQVVAPLNDSPTLSTSTSTSTTSSTTPIYSKEGMEIAREYGRMIMQEYIGSLTRDDIFPKRAMDKDPLLKKSHVLEIDVVDVKKGSTPLLIWVKGRKKARATWVPLHWSSLNHNDCFLLDTGKIVYIYNGQYSNKLCRAKALDMSQMIKYKERGGDCQVVIIDGGVYTNLTNSTSSNSTSSNSINTSSDLTPLLKKQMTQFWTLLGVSDPLGGGPPPTEDSFMKLLSEQYPPVERVQMKSSNTSSSTHTSNVFSKLKLSEKSKYMCQDEISDDLYQQLNDLGQRLYKLNSEIFEEMPLQIEKQETQDAYIKRIAPHMLSVIKLNQVPHGEMETLSQLKECIEKGELNQLEIIQPSHHVLHSDQCYIFESLFTNEVFFWSGKQSNINIRKWGIAIAKKLAQYRARNDTPFSLMNPVIQRARRRWSTSNLSSMSSNSSMSSTSNNSNNGSFFISTVTRVIEEGEHSMFKQKFSDYPGMLMIQTQHQEASRGNIAEKKKQQKIPFEELLKQKYASMMMMVSRKDMNGGSGSGDPFMNQQHQICNSKIRMWRVSDFQRIPYSHIGHFFSGDAFILLYSYTKVEGGKPFHKLFFWQGRDIKKKDKGTSAYKTVEVNEMIDEGVVEQQVRVIQDKEPPLFMDLFLTGGALESSGSSSRITTQTTTTTTTEDKLNQPHRVPYVVHKGKYRESVLEAFEKAQKGMSQKNVSILRGSSSSTWSTSNSNNNTPLSERELANNEDELFFIQDSTTPTTPSESPASATAVASSSLWDDETATRTSTRSSSSSSSPNTTTTSTSTTSTSTNTLTTTTVSTSTTSSLDKWKDNNNNCTSNHRITTETSMSTQPPIKLFSNLNKSNLDDNNEKKYSPQVLQFQKEMIQQIAMKSLFDPSNITLHCYDIRDGRVCECDDLHPVYLNPFHAMIFSNYNFVVALHRKELNIQNSSVGDNSIGSGSIGSMDVAASPSLSSTTMDPSHHHHHEQEGKQQQQLIVYYGPYCPSHEKKFIENDLLKELFSSLFSRENVIFIDHSQQQHENAIEQLSKYVFKSSIDPYFEPFLLRFKNYFSMQKDHLKNSTTRLATTLTTPTLYSINDHSGEFTMTPIPHYGESDLSSTQAYILDALDLEEQVYVWIGKLCPTETKKFALASVLEYYHTWKCQQQQHDSFYTKKNHFQNNEDDFDPTSLVKKEDEMNLRVVTELEEPPEFTRHFLAWSTSSTSFKVRYKQSKDPNVISKGFVKTPRTPRRTTHTHQIIKSSSVDQDHSSGVYEIEHCPTCTSLYNKLFSHQTYSYKVLTSGSLPEGIDKSKLETYLSNDEFIKVFGMDKKKFSQLQTWKQTSLKKEKNLF